MCFPDRISTDLRYIQCLYSAETVAAYYVMVYQGLTNGNMTAEQRASLPPESQEYHSRVYGSKTQLMGWVVYTVLLWTLKTCMLIFYSRLTCVFHSLPPALPLWNIPASQMVTEKFTGIKSVTWQFVSR